MTSIYIELHMRPPAETIAPTGLADSTAHAFAVKSGPKSGCSAYYAALRDALAAARAKTGDELTAWRDAVGSRELRKEPRLPKKDEEEGEEEEEEDDVEWIGSSA
jgi:hypothetical protein